MAINPEINFSYGEVISWLGHIGQNKGYFLAQLPSNFITKILSKIENDLQNENIKSELIKLQNNKAIIRVEYNNNSDFNELALIYYKKDSRLQLVLSDKEQYPPIKDISLLKSSDFKSTISIKIEEKSKYDPTDLKKMIDFFSLHFLTASKITFVGRYFQVFDNNSVAERKTNFYYFLEELFKFFKQNKARCEEITIYSMIDRSWEQILRSHSKSIESFFHALQKNLKIKYGIKHIFLENDSITKKKLHDRFILTNYAMFSLGSEFSTTENTISLIGDENLINERQNFWQEGGLDLPIFKIIHA